jgi:5-methylcytosine-specific restriction endonuclease McrA
VPVLVCTEKMKHEYSHLYTSYRWRRRREQQLRREPLCAWCGRRGRVASASVAHHVEPHRGDLNKFWFGALISLCKECHDIDAQRIEHGGCARAIVDADGWPMPLETKT